ncbi:MAG: methyltransferase domain-containing protein [Anaerolineales bacterium]|nr:methyltransferase domain-containing protein [Anaerolineales bacterium]
MINSQPICSGDNIIPLVEMKQVPVHCNVLWPTQDEALAAPRGDIRLGYFPNCGHIFNLDFDPSLMAYTQEYENSLHFSPRFQQYATALAERLIADYNLHDKDIVEIGAGKGDFLIMMAEMGNNRGWGFDPSYVPDEAYSSEKVTFVLDFYSEKYTDYKADMITCRHVLEHIETPDAFIETVRRAVGDRKETIVFFEMPNALFTLKRGGIWDIIYEHCSYFTPQSLTYLFEKHGFEVLAVNEVFEGQFLTIEAKPADETAVSTPNTTSLTQDAATFADSYQNKVDHWKAILQGIKDGGKTAVIWGTGSKGVTFLNVLDPERIIQYAVDINPRKQGKFVGGTGQEIVSPDFLATYRPDVVIIMNANYKDEIGKMLQERGISAEILLA